MIIDLTQLKRKPLTNEEATIAEAMYMAPETIREVLDKIEALSVGSKFMIDDIPNTGALATKEEIADIQNQLAATNSYTPASTPVPERRNPKTGHVIIGARGDKTVYRCC